MDGTDHSDHYRRLAAGRNADRVLSGLMLRRVALSILLRHGAPMSVAEICQVIEAQGFTTNGNPHIKVGQALSVEHRRGWAHRVGWGQYRIGRLSSTSRWRVLNVRPRPGTPFALD